MTVRKGIKLNIHEFHASQSLSMMIHTKVYTEPERILEILTAWKKIVPNYSRVLSHCFFTERFPSFPAFHLRLSNRAGSFTSSLTERYISFKWARWVWKCCLYNRPSNYTGKLITRTHAACLVGRPQRWRRWTGRPIAVAAVAGSSAEWVSRVYLPD